MDMVEIIKRELIELNNGDESRREDLQILVKVYNKYSNEKIRITFNGFNAGDRYVIRVVNK